MNITKEICVRRETIDRGFANIIKELNLECKCLTVSCCSGLREDHPDIEEYIQSYIKFQSSYPIIRESAKSTEWLIYEEKKVEEYKSKPEYEEPEIEEEIWQNFLDEHPEFTAGMNDKESENEIDNERRNKMVYVVKIDESKIHSCDDEKKRIWNHFIEKVRTKVGDRIEDFEKRNREQIKKSIDLTISRIKEDRDALVVLNASMGKTQMAKLGNIFAEELQGSSDKKISSYFVGMDDNAKKMKKIKEIINDGEIAVIHFSYSVIGISTQKKLHDAVNDIRKNVRLYVSDAQKRNIRSVFITNPHSFWILSPVLQGNDTMLCDIARFQDGNSEQNDFGMIDSS